MIFAAPAWLLGLVLLPGLFGVEGFLRRRDLERLARLVSRPLWGRVVRRTSERWRVARLALLLLGAAGLLLALARPQWGIVREKVEREGVDVVLVLDTSGSMATADVAPSRFFLARQALLQLAARLEGDRLALVAFEGEAYPLVPLTLDADALALFLETVEPGIVPAPGSSLGLGLAKGLEAFVDPERRNKALVLVSDGEDLEGEVDEAVRRAKQAGVVVHTVGVGTEAGQPVPELDVDGRVTGYKRDEQGSAVVSRLNMETLEAIARGTGGKAFRLTPADVSLSALASAIEGMEQRALAREYTYRRRERFQAPLAVALACLALSLLLPPPLPQRRAAARGARPVAAALVAALVLPALAQEGPPPGAEPEPRSGTWLDELLLRPRRATEEGRAEYARGNHPQALEAFERAVRSRPQDPSTRFNLADGLYKSGKHAEAAALFRSLGSEAGSPLAAASRFNLGNSLYQAQDYRGAIRSYRDALRLAPGDEDARRNLELALRALKEQEEREKKQDPSREGSKDRQDRQQPGENQRSPGSRGDQRPKTQQEQEDQRFRQETGMPKERAMQLLEALQQNEEAEQKKLLAQKRGQKKKGKDW
ncbi:MAG TPA: VWA domain-containing protein [Vicinamibacteria bacterium]|nr:VWA domain-containing protein [Vicinamibacteria bacterium]